TSTSSPGSRRAACASSPPAGSARPPTSTRSLPRAQRRPSSAAPCSGRDELQVGLQLVEGEAGRRPPARDEILREQAVALVDVALPEGPRHLLEHPPGDECER